MHNDHKKPSNIQLKPASRFSIQELTEIYNQTRVDYIIPMPMNIDRLRKYIAIYNVDLEHSIVATTPGGDVLGVAMLGVREKRAWLTRIGVIPNNRQSGVARLMVRNLVDHANQLDINFIMLEVIKGNIPAYRLFSKFGFKEMGELLILRRSPSHLPFDVDFTEVQFLNRTESLLLIERGFGIQPWTNQPETMINLDGVSGLRVTMADGSCGWLVFQLDKSTLKHFVFNTESGDPVTMAETCLSHLHHKHLFLNSDIENIRVNDPHLPAFYKMGYVEAFRRIEMWRDSFPLDLNQKFS